MSTPKPGTLGARMRDAAPTTTETVTVQHGDGRLVVHLPISVGLLAILLSGVDARHPGSRTIDTGREDVLVVELAPEVDDGWPYR